MKKVIYLLLIIILFYIELCCSHCLYENQHSNHKVLKIDDEESLKKENITIEENSKEIEEDLQKMNNIKEKIENEITNINTVFYQAILYSKNRMPS